MSHICAALVINRADVRYPRLNEILTCQAIIDRQRLGLWILGSVEKVIDEVGSSLAGSMPYFLRKCA